MKYSKIHLVTINQLKKNINDRGYLIEIQRNDDTHFPGFGQAYITSTKPGITKAWYRHKQQTDQITVIKGTMLLTLYDSREHSPTYRHIQEIQINDSKPLLVQIPAGVWHGFKAISEEDVLLLHLNAAAWVSEKPDEERLPIDTDAIPYTWL